MKAFTSLVILQSEPAVLNKFSLKMCIFFVSLISCVELVLNSKEQDNPGTGKDLYGKITYIM